MTATVELVDAGAAGDPALVDALAGVINGAYAVGERDLWREGVTRTTPAEVAEMIGAGDLLAATVAGSFAGCARVRMLDADTAELGLISVAPDQWGTGVGRELFRTAEQLMRSRGVSVVELELLVPQGRPHPVKDRLREWYLRLGYAIVRTAACEEVVGHRAVELATPAEFLIFRKALA
jgi:GNAT superfamily N-acetyltransferase